MLITPQMITQKSYCHEQLLAFQFATANFPKGAELQDILDACAKAGDSGCAFYLLEQFGACHKTHIIHGDTKRPALFIDGHLYVTGDLHVDSFLVASKSITVNGNIKTGKSIVAAGGDLIAQGGIVSGRNMYVAHSINAWGDITAQYDIVTADGGISTRRDGEPGSSPVYMGDIEAGGSIFVGLNIEARDHVKVGADGHVYSGMQACLIEHRESDGIVRSRYKPENLIVGTWRPHEPGRRDGEISPIETN